MTAMPKGYPIRECRSCQEPADDRATLSRTGLCIDCSNRIQREATLQLIAHDGPWFDHWRARCLAAFGVNIADQPSDTEGSMA